MDTTQSSTAPSSVAAIEDELRRLWRETGEQHVDSESVVTRVCTLTLIAYGADATLATRVRKAVPSVYANHPCRAIMIEATGTPDQLSAWVTTVCQMPSGHGQQVCCEQITVTVGEEMRRRLPGTVLPLVMADLPIVVWWPGPLRTSNVRRQLYAHADRWIIDSADFENPLTDLLQLHHEITSDPHTAVSDFVWARLTPWRSMLARIFDHPTTRPALQALTLVELEGNGSLASMLLSVGWLASALGWRFQTLSETETVVQSLWTAAHGTVEVRFPRHPGVSDAARTITMASQAVPNLVINLERNQQGTVLLASVILGAETLTYAGELPSVNDGALLDHELNVYGHDRVYERALTAVADMLTRERGTG